MSARETKHGIAPNFHFESNILKCKSIHILPRFFFGKTPRIFCMFHKIYKIETYEIDGFSMRGEGEAGLGGSGK